MHVANHKRGRVLSWQCRWGGSSLPQLGGCFLLLGLKVCVFVTGDHDDNMMAYNMAYG